MNLCVVQIGNVPCSVLFSSGIHLAWWRLLYFIQIQEYIDLDHPLFFELQDRYELSNSLKTAKQIWSFQFYVVFFSRRTGMTCLPWPRSRSGSQPSEVHAMDLVRMVSCCGKTWVKLAGKPCLGETEHFWRLGFGDLAGMGNDYGRTSVSEGLYESIRWHTMAYCATSVAFFDDMLLWWYNSWVGLKENHHRKPRFCLPLKIGFMGGVRRPSTRKARSKDVGLQAKPYRTVPMVLHGCWRWLVSVYGYWHHGYSWFSNYQMVINEMWMVVVPCVLYFWTIFVCSTLSFGSFSQLNVGLSECSGGPSLRWILHGLCDHNLPALLNALAKLRRHQGKQKPSTA